MDTRSEAVGVEERPFSRNFSKSLEGRWSQKWGGAKGGAPSDIRRTDARLALSLWFMLSWRLWFTLSLVFGGFAVLRFIALVPLGPVVWPVVLWSDLFVGGVGRKRVRATHRRRGLKAQLCRLCGANLRVRARSAGESSPPTREARDQARPR